MTVPRSTVALFSLLWIVPALAQAQDDAPDAPAGASVLQVQDEPDQIIRVNTRIRHTTVIQLPAAETILDFIVGDSEYWHLTGAANLAFLKPIGEGVNTNVALVCESGRIYSFLVTEQSGPPALDRPHRRRPEQHPGQRPRPRVRRALARGRVSTDGRGKPRGGPCRAAGRRGADHRHAPGRRRPGRRVSFDLSHAVAVPLSSWRTRPRAGRSWCTACGTTGNLPTSDPRPRRRPRCTRTQTGNRPSSRTTSKRRRLVYRAAACRAWLAPDRARPRRLERGP